MWIENVNVYDEIEPSKLFKWSVCMSLEKIIHLKNSLSVQLESQKLRINILIIYAHFLQGLIQGGGGELGG